MRRFFTFLLGAGFTLVVIALATPQSDPVIAQETDDDDIQMAVEVTGDNSYCSLCHSQEGRAVTLSDGSSLNLHVPASAVADSVHGTNNEAGALGCVDCHTDSSFPHVNPLPATARLYTIDSSEICTRCHTEQASELQDGVHEAGLARGNTRAASCVDCHGAHDVQPAEEHPALTAQVCGDCHTTVFAEYEDSIHGQALLVNDDTNAPDCTTCHGVHGIEHPTTAEARNQSPQLCGECHADEDLMEEYDISTNVFDSYLAEFHGTTTTLFEEGSPEVPANTAVCYDCHGVHNITPADDSKSQVAKENLLITCQQCHPDATADFSDSWVGHFEPTVEDNPGLFAVDLFYDILIPSVLGGFVLIVVSDVFMRVRTRGAPHPTSSPPPSEPVANEPEEPEEKKEDDEA